MLLQSLVSAADGPRRGDGGAGEDGGFGGGSEVCMPHIYMLNRYSRIPGT